MADRMRVTSLSLMGGTSTRDGLCLPGRLPTSIPVIWTQIPDYLAARDGQATPGYNSSMRTISPVFLSLSRPPAPAADGLALSLIQPASSLRLAPTPINEGGRR